MTFSEARKPKLKRAGRLQCSLGSASAFIDGSAFDRDFLTPSPQYTGASRFMAEMARDAAACACGASIDYCYLIIKSGVMTSHVSVFVCFCGEDFILYSCVFSSFLSVI